MAYSALIDDLEKQFAENPRRVFARLANEYRKAGDLERAIAYCRAHIPTAPSYISGYIVLGQALYESQRFEEARQAFETALNLDPENLIALRQLGDIARQNGDNESARAWYQRLLEVDPQNDEVAAHLSSLTPRPRADSGAGWWPSDNAIGWQGVMQSPPGSTAPTDAGYAMPAPEPVSAGVPEADIVSDAPAHGDGIAEHEPLDQYLSDGELFAPETYLPIADEPDVGAASIESFAPSAEAIDIERTGFEAETPFVAEDIAAFSRESYDGIGDADVAQTDGAADAPATADAEGASDAEVAPMYDPLIGREMDFDAPQTPAPAFVTETMADLYLQQGFTGEAMAIYRQLVDENPDDESLRLRLADIERMATPSASAPREAANGELPDVRRSNVRRVFSGLASRRAPRRAEGNGNGSTNGDGVAGTVGMFGAAHVAAGEELAARRLAGAFSDQYRDASAGRSSLEMLFGDAAADGHAPAPVDSANVSFDEFFAGGSPRAARAEELGDASAKSDLDTFHAWLGGLKQ